MKKRLVLPILLLVALPLLAQYKMPPKEIADVVDAPPPPFTTISPDGKWILLQNVPSLLTIEDLSRPELKLAGIRFDPERHDQSRATYATSLAVVRVADGQSRPVGGLASPAHIRFATWSPDSMHVAFTVSTANGAELWVADAATAGAHRVSSLLMNQTFPRRPFEWTPDSRALVARTVPSSRAAALPERTTTPSGPVVQESRGRKAPARTYEDMIKDEADAALFEYHMQSALMRIPLDGQPQPLGDVAMIVNHAVSPDGRYLLVESIHRPFSYTVPYFRFPQKIEIWSMDGKLVKQIADLPLRDRVSIDFDAVAVGPREVEWRADKPATLAWVEAQDEGNPRKDAAVRDRILTLGAPFDGAPATLADLPMRYGGVEWGSDDVALVEAERWKDRRAQLWRVHPNGSAAPELVVERSSEDRYGDPGQPAMRPNASGHYVLQLSGNSIYLFGEGHSPEGSRPFIDRFDLTTKKATRLWRSEAPVYEQPIVLLDDTRALTRRESPAEPPNVFARDLKSGALRQITKITNPTPQMMAVKKELIRYKRADGVDLNATLYLPPGYDAAKDGPLPVLMWAYPTEFKSAAAASQITTSPYRYVRASATGSPIVFTLRGYAVLDNPTIPIVGEGTREPNDTYVEQLVAGAKAAVDELVRRGVGDKDRMAISGHSYGAFMTANLLAHSDLFRAGIARSGAYNRTLTPFSFQAEERTYWEAPETYTKMSPFTYADKINEPLLLIHGIDDDNAGTFPVQSERLYAAMAGLGGTVRLVMLPKEAHGYRARESVMHVLYEMDAWLDKYVKNAAKRAATAAP